MPSLWAIRNRKVRRMRVDPTNIWWPTLSSSFSISCHTLPRVGSSLTRDWACTCCSGSTEEPLNRQGSPVLSLLTTPNSLAAVYLLFELTWHLLITLLFFSLIQLVRSLLQWLLPSSTHKRWVFPKNEHSILHFFHSARVWAIYSSHVATA